VIDNKADLLNDLKTFLVMSLLGPMSRCGHESGGLGGSESGGLGGSGSGLGQA
jgi:hypothetical protein